MGKLHLLNSFRCLQAIYLEWSACNMSKDCIGYRQWQSINALVAEGLHRCNLSTCDRCQPLVSCSVAGCRATKRLRSCRSMKLPKLPWHCQRCNIVRYHSKVEISDEYGPAGYRCVKHGARRCIVLG